MPYETLLFQREEGFVVVTLNRPPANAINEKLVTELNDALNAVEHDDAVRAVIITGAGDRIFCGGADLGSAFSGGSVDVFIRFGNSVMRKLQRFPKPVIAAVNGHATGAGLVNRLSKEGETLNDAKALARQLARRAPIATRLLIEVVDDGLEAPIDKASDIEVRAFLKTLRTEDAAEGIQAFFGKREPNFKGK